MSNFLLNTDSYKHSHAFQYPEGTEYVQSYIESRGGPFSKSVFFGLQAFLQKYLTTPITLENVKEAEFICRLHGVPFFAEGWNYIVTELKGMLPLRIRAVPEGTVLPVGLPLVTIVNTDPKCFWLTSFAETAILRAVWYPTTVATISYTARQSIKKYLEETGDVVGLPFKLHDFGARGVSSEESAAIGGAAHLATGAMGTDTMSALLFARKYYGEEMAGFSIPASEHSTITSWGREHEVDAMRNMIQKFSGAGKLYACVSDSYDVYDATENKWGGELHNLVIESGGTLVVRPDSGEPVEVVLKVIKLLDKKFGSTVNEKGYKVLHPSVRVIQGDGVNLQSIPAILEVLKQAGYSADNIAFGMGGKLLQGLDRDTMKFAMKACAARVNGMWRDVFKDPITDSGKRSKKGRVETVKDWTTGEYKVHDFTKPVEGADIVMNTVYENGTMRVYQTLAEVRSRVAKG